MTPGLCLLLKPSQVSVHLESCCPGLLKTLAWGHHLEEKLPFTSCPPDFLTAPPPQHNQSQAKQSPCPKVCCVPSPFLCAKDAETLGAPGWHLLVCPFPGGRGGDAEGVHGKVC